MNILFKLVIGISVLVAILLMVAAFVKNEYTIQREIVIDKPKQVVFDYIKYLKNQDKYNKWVMTDPNMKKIFKGTDGNVGFVYGWDGNRQAGKGEEEIINISNGEKLKIEIRFIKPFEGIAQTVLTTETINEGQTRLHWMMSGRNKYPMNLMNLMMDNVLGKDLSASLEMLKSQLEK